MTPTRDPRNPADTSSAPRDNKRAEAEFSLNPPNAPDVPRRETAAVGGAGAGASGHEPTAIHIDAWLNAFARLLNLPAERRREIVAELEAHLTERVRDLMIDGHAEAAATQLAIRELGDAAVIASRFHKAERTHPRRWIMNTLILGVSAAAISLSTLALRQAAVAPPSHAPNSPPAQSSTLSAQSTIPESLSSLDPDFATTTTAPEPTFTVRAGETAAEFFDDFAKSFGVSAFVHWDQFERIQLRPETTIAMGAVAIPRSEAWKLVQDQITRSGGLGWRLRADQVEVSLQQDLDRREIELAAYDLTKFLSDYPPNEANMITQNAMQLVTQTIEPTYWSQNDGDLASIHAVGRKLFVRAPKRVHENIRWIINQLETPGDDVATLPLGNRLSKADSDALSEFLVARQANTVRLQGKANPFQEVLPRNGTLTLKRFLSAGVKFNEGAKSIIVQRLSPENAVITIATIPVAEWSDPKTPDIQLAAGDVVTIE